MDLEKSGNYRQKESKRERKEMQKGEEGTKGNQRPSVQAPARSRQRHGAEAGRDHQR